MHLRRSRSSKLLLLGKMLAVSQKENPDLGLITAKAIMAPILEIRTVTKFIWFFVAI
jgi:hypothetical protein